MADHSKPVLTSTYTNFVSELSARFNDLAVGMDPAVTTATLMPTNSIRWNSVSKLWEKYNGTAWVALSADYAVTITGSAAKWTTARTITLGTDATGNVSLDGSANVTLNMTLNTVPATKGGTGQTTYAVGDILVGGATNTLTKVADVAAGNVLLSGGVGVAPAYGKVTLTGHVSGILGVANGGTGVATLTGLPWGNGTGAFSVATAAQIVGAISTTAVANATAAVTATTAGKSTNLVGSTVGSIPYQSAVDTTLFIPDVATGNALISGGVGVVPAYGKIGLTTHVSGTLPIANGGTGGTTQATALQALGAVASQVVAKSTTYSVVAGDRGDVFFCTGTWTLSMAATATLGGGFSFGIVNSGTGTITIDPNLAETIDGLTTKAITPGQSCLLITDGVNWQTVGLSGGGAKGGGADDIFYENSQTVNTNYTITTNKNAMSAGPITIANGVTVTVPNGSTWSIV